MSETIQLTCCRRIPFPAYVARPAGAARGAVVVVQEIFGVNAHIRAVADGYAAAGYLAVAPDAFHRVKPGVELGYTPEDIQAGIALKARSRRCRPRRAAGPAGCVDHAARVGRQGGHGGVLLGRAADLAQRLPVARPGGGGAVLRGRHDGRRGARARAACARCLCHFGAQDHAIAWTRSRPSGPPNRTSRCRSTTPSMASTATTVAPTTRRRGWRANARWPSLSAISPEPAPGRQRLPTPGLLAARR
jgi:carboxymethylenebutenolidase